MVIGLMISGNSASKMTLVCRTIISMPGKPAGQPPDGASVLAAVMASAKVQVPFESTMIAPSAEESASKEPASQPEPAGRLYPR